MPGIDPDSLQSYVQRTHRRLQALEARRPGDRRTGNRRAGTVQFEFVRLCEPLHPGDSARGNVVVWNHELEKFVETGTGCVIVFDDRCRVFGLPGEVVDTVRRYGKFATYQESGITNVQAKVVNDEGSLRVSVPYDPHCYWDQDVFIDVPTLDNLVEGDDVMVTLNRFTCEWELVLLNADDAGTTTTTPDPLPQPESCEGRCKWEWDATEQEWILLEDNCASTTTTTTTTTEPTTTTTPDPTSSTTTTTRESCPCLGECTTTAEPCGGVCLWDCVDSDWVINQNDCDPGCECIQPMVPCVDQVAEPGECVPESTTTTTTTTPDLCQCNPPDFCGHADEDCTSTFCVKGDPRQPPPCDCDCGSTTTTPDGPTGRCAEYDCEWIWVPHSPNPRWVKVQDCPESDQETGGPCECSQPDQSNPECLESVFTPCATDPASYCRGECNWIWLPAPFSYWTLDENRCESPSWIGCVCEPPTEPPSDITECVSAGTECYANEIDRCDEICNSSTTTNECSGGCRWQWNTVEERWEIAAGSNSCAAECPCRKPVHSGDEDCDMVRMPCDTFNTSTTTTPDGGGSTTTTPDGGTTTTTPSNCQGLCRFECINNVPTQNPQDQCGINPFACDCEISWPGGVVPTDCDDGDVWWGTCQKP